MSERGFLDDVAGYKELLERRALKRETGSDFQEDRWAVKRQVEALHPHRIAMTVKDLIDETPTCKTIRLEPANGHQLPAFQAGQYVNLFVTVNGVETARPFAISSAPSTRTHYDLTIRIFERGFVSPYLLDGLEIGDSVSTSSPMGNFHYNPVFHGRDLVFLAGGSGIAPAMSMIHAFAALDEKPRFHIIYGSRTETDIIFRDRLRQLTETHEFLTVTEVISEPGPDYKGHKGFLDRELISLLIKNPQESTFYVCGPTVMNELCVNALKGLGVRDARIRVEANGPPRQVEKEANWPDDVSPQKSVTISIRGKGQFQSVSGEPLLNALERHGYNAENACRSGECSLCRTRLLSGTVFHPEQSRVRFSDRQFGWIHSCVAYPLDDIEIEL